MSEQNREHKPAAPRGHKGPGGPEWSWNEDLKQKKLKILKVHFVA